MRITILFLLLSSALLWRCNTPTTAQATIAPSDKAQVLANEIMQAMGGQRAWDETRFISWNFFGARQLLWDKYTGRVRIDVPEKGMVYLININDTEGGRIQQQGQVLTQPDSIAKYTNQGKSIWINDAYWLVMPYKLKDEGVTLRYVGKGKTQADEEAEILELTFADVGDTPQNKYHIYVNPVSKLVTQWDYYAKASDEAPRFALPWNDYRQYGQIMLSGNRGERQLTDIAVYSTVPDAAFTEFAVPDRESWIPTK